MKKKNTKLIVLIIFLGILSGIIFPIIKGDLILSLNSFSDSLTTFFNSIFPTLNGRAEIISENIISYTGSHGTSNATFINNYIDVSSIFGSISSCYNGVSDITYEINGSEIYVEVIYDNSGSGSGFRSCITPIEPNELLIRYKIPLRSVNSDMKLFVNDFEETWVYLNESNPYIIDDFEDGDIINNPVWNASNSGIIEVNTNSKHQGLFGVFIDGQGEVSSNIITNISSNEDTFRVWSKRVLNNGGNFGFYILNESGYQARIFWNDENLFYCYGSGDCVVWSSDKPLLNKWYLFEIYHPSNSLNINFKIYDSDGTTVLNQASVTHPSNSFSNELMLLDVYKDQAFFDYPSTNEIFEFQGFEFGELINIDYFSLLIGVFIGVILSFLIILFNWQKKFIQFNDILIKIFKNLTKKQIIIAIIVIIVGIILGIIF